MMNQVHNSLNVKRSKPGMVTIARMMTWHLWLGRVRMKTEGLGSSRLLKCSEWISRQEMLLTPSWIINGTVSTHPCSEHLVSPQFFREEMECGTNSYTKVPLLWDKSSLSDLTRCLFPSESGIQRQESILSKTPEAEKSLLMAGTVQFNSQVWLRAIRAAVRIDMLVLSTI